MTRTRTVCVDQGHWEDSAGSGRGRRLRACGRLRDGLWRLQHGLRRLHGGCRQRLHDGGLHSVVCSGDLPRVGLQAGPDAGKLHLQRSPDGSGSLHVPGDAVPSGNADAERARVPAGLEHGELSVQRVPDAERDAVADRDGVRNGALDQSYQYNVCLTRTETRSRTVPVCEMVPTQQTYQYNVCLTRNETRTRTVACASWSPQRRPISTTSA